MALRSLYAVAKAYRPISLNIIDTESYEKTAAKITLGKPLYVVQKPLHSNQHAYQLGKACDSPPQQVLSRVEASTNNQESSNSISGHRRSISMSTIRAASNRGVKNTICRWIKAREILSLLLWDFVID